MQTAGLRPRPRVAADGVTQRGLDGLIALPGAWTVVEALIFSGTELKWWSFASACALAGLSVIGLAVHEMTTERVVFTN